MGVEQAFQQAEARSLGGAEIITLVSPGTPVDFVTPTIEDRSVAKPGNPVLLARAANESVIDLVVGQSLSRLRSDERVSAFLYKVMSKIQRHQRSQLVSEIVTHALEVSLEIEILSEAAA